MLRCLVWFGIDQAIEQDGENEEMNPENLHDVDELIAHLQTPSIPRQGAYTQPVSTLHQLPSQSAVTTSPAYL